MSDISKPVIGIIGGTGSLGSGLAKGWARAGHQVIIGSRAAEKAASAAAELGFGIEGDSNWAAAAASDIVVLTVPFSNHGAILGEIKPAVDGKIVVDTTVPLAPPKVSKVQLPEGGSAALITQRLLGETVRVVSAFHTLGAAKLHAGERADCDVLVFSDDKGARNTVIALAELVARRGIGGGSLANSAAAEAMTSVLIWINRQCKITGAGIAVTGLEAAQQA
ncbi:NADPH-dependent F420 reductase [Methyloligella sp. 2.7D]|uniref:NADPH-dependent F420 reductase n=1 Tax=unclassified Methyloligella TaxID=2625955 RepID=UPI00157D942D|nr:NADPH-dependent F420 reductase [Methyloligella sp. GL2]QKP78215.1 NADPH-dependent F420 reductase [Methyloligella sp. GL2]